MSVDRSQIKVDQIVHSDNVSPPTISFGATCVSGQIFSALGGVTVSGVCTATSFIGDGSALTGLPVATVGQIVGAIMSGTSR